MGSGRAHIDHARRKTSLGGLKIGCQRVKGEDVEPGVGIRIERETHWKQAFPSRSPGSAVQYGRLEVSIGLRATWAKGGAVRESGGVGSQVAFLDRHLVDGAHSKLPKSCARMGAEREREEGVVGGWKVS